MDYTDAQCEAIFNHDQNLIVVAGAGSGKTRVLVERYLSLLEQHPDWPLNVLVAITFTRKAAGEMRDRVRDELVKRLRTAETAYDQERWSSLLAQMDSARIDTIHGLCANILRANAAYTGLDPDFEVLDEINARILLEDMVDRVVQELVTENHPAVNLFAEYEPHVMGDVLANSDLLARIPEEVPADLVNWWRARWSQDAAVQLEVFRRQCEALGTWQPPDGDDRLSQGWRLCIDALTMLHDQGASLDQRRECVAQIAQIQLIGGSARIWGDRETLNAAKSALGQFRDAARETLAVIGEEPGWLDQRAAELLPMWCALLGRVRAGYAAAKRDQGLLDFNDLEGLTWRLLDDFPEIRQRYQQVEFKHLLVDEFQDTNGLQWDIVRALAPLNSPGALFVVGDPKQSIYAFRGADVSVFDAVQQEIIQAGGDAVAMACSFRAHQPLVDCFNAVFERLLTRDENSPVQRYEVTLGEKMSAYRPAAPSNDWPLLDLMIMDRRLPVSDGAKPSTDDARRWEAYTIAARLHEMFERHVPVYDRAAGVTRPVQYDDMALLFQSTTQITLYEDVFKAVGLPFVTVSGRGYYSRQEVWDLLNLLRALYNRADDLSLAAALRSPLFNLSDDALLALRLPRADGRRPASLWEGLADPQGVSEDELPTVMFAARCLLDLHRMAGRVTISELLRAALSQTGYLAALTGLPDGARRRGNVEKLLEKAEASGKVTLGAFTQYLNELSAREVREGEALLEAQGAVTLMTVHASKGLEYPVIVLADTSWEKRGGGRDVVLFDADFGLACKVYDPDQDKLAETYAYRRVDYLDQLRQEAERKRLLYVAATRAQDYLIVGGQLSTSGRANGWLKWLLDGLDIETLGSGETLLRYPWGLARLHLPVEMPPPEVLTLDADAQHSAWEHENVRRGEALPGDSAEPPLLKQVLVARDAPARHLAATQIANIGGAHYASSEQERLFYRDTLRRRVLHDAPAHVPSVGMREQGVSGRQIGDVVHEALRYWRFPHNQEDLAGLLRSYAWRHGVIDADSQRRAVTEAQKLLKRITSSDVYHWIQAAHDAGRPVYHELPFVYRAEKRTIHGVIDVLFLREDNTWVIVDYKTGLVGRNPGQAVLREHARRYHLQVGVYAAAVQAQLEGLVPETYIHYLRYSPGTVKIEIPEWRAALEQMENLIGDIIWDEKS